MPEINFKEMFLVPDGPPESVWERAVDAVYAAAEQDSAQDDPSAGAVVSGPEDAGILAMSGDEDHSDATHDNDSGTPDWDNRQGHDRDAVEGGDDDGDGIPGGGDDLL
ncbi:hypothetical protein QFZ23_002294 [Arthrobacter globiformis]|uniref:hypothetical protein n=1 Tax=Arthrobacter globiformis TaxID=1665 RepID=UPI0027875945|nr:hypothetical protein [Arthrobacter globiformis]MDQ1058393.1 hypothetical protein [Arthrobacter globiformis]